MNENNITLHKAHTQDGNRFYIKTIWKDSLFELLLLVGDSAWRGECSAPNLRQLSSDFNEPEEVYLSNVKLCFTTCSDKYLYELQPGDDNSMLFLWKIKFADGTVMKYGSLRLVPHESRDNFIDYLVDSNGQLKQSLCESMNINKKLESELEKALTDLERLNAMKVEMESNLYGKFVQLLNAKKRRIRVLEKSVSNLNVSSDSNIMEMEN